MPTIYSKRHPRSTPEFVVLEIGVMNRNGRTYMRDVVEAGLKQYPISNPQMFGMFMEHAQGGNIQIDKVSHLAENVHIRGNKVYATIKPLKTPQGMILSKLLALDLVEFRTGGAYTHLDSNGCVQNWTLWSINAVLRGQGA